MGRIRACGHWRIPDRAIRRQRSMGRADCGVFVWVLRIEQEASAGLFIRPPDVRNGVLAVACDWIHFCVGRSDPVHAGGSGARSIVGEG